MALLVTCLVITTPTGNFSNFFINSLDGNERKILLHFNTLIHFPTFVIKFIDLYRMSAAICLWVKADITYISGLKFVKIYQR